MPLEKFTVIVIGGGPVGLTAAHALTHANIDFVLLERRPAVVTDAGSHLVMLPAAMRTLGQLGLHDALQRVSAPLDSKIGRCDHMGRDLGDVHFFELQKEYFGALPRVITRHDLLQVLHDTLPEATQARIHTNKKITSISTTDTGVLATCADGTSFSGTIIIGADGVHSVVREHMRLLALKASASSSSITSSPDASLKDRKASHDSSSSTSIANMTNMTNINSPDYPFEANYRAMWIRFPTPSYLPIGTTCESHGPGAATQYFAAPGTSVAGVYERLPSPITRGQRIHFSAADQAAMAARWGHLPLIHGRKLNVRDAFESRIDSGLVTLEVGVLEHWSWDGRIVLVGDAAHKYTPSTGAGCNNGILDVAALVNQLHRAVHQSRTFYPSSSTSSSSDFGQDRALLAHAFTAYQDSRYAAVVAGCKGSGDATATATWQSRIHRFLDLYAMPFRIVQRFLARKEASDLAQAQPFSFIQGEERISGNMAWGVPIPNSKLS